ncbi:hypothetical protein ACIN8IBEIGE_20333 [Acinetobacter sp. 8I-beige]|nr:hypothetical protein ACIN8IBEIGE_130003 [Acinetobacter sp. 8I-beige]VXA84997.1 hypothetical protein ACIN8IBEIGE_20333 [Acinetobacter sp. 8I-beige]
MHVLSLPPAFNLSHDQTLQLKIISSLWLQILAHQFSDKYFSNKLRVIFTIQSMKYFRSINQ